MALTEAAKLRAQLKHPILDCDGHWIETVPVFLEYLAQAGGPQSVDAYRKLSVERASMRWMSVTPEERLAKRLPKDLGVGNSGTLDVATAMLPALMYERLQELGIDFSIIYPSMGLGMLTLDDPDLRRAAVRAYNRMAADIYAPFKTRFAPVAIIPTQTPEEALAELDYAVGTLGLKGIMLFGALPRPIPDSGKASFGGSFSKGSFSTPYFVDPIGLDDDAYDPFWARCQKLGVAVTSHGGSTDWIDRRSITNNMFNHIGHFAQANHAFCKGVFLAGLPRRFPNLNFAFMEGGVAYAVSLLWDIIGHWEKFNIPSILEHYNPARTDFDQMAKLLAAYGSPVVREKLDDIMKGFRRDPVTPPDYWSASGVTSKQDIRELFARNFYFGCEADDPGAAWAFDAKKGAPLKAIFSSDLSHPDVPVMEAVVPEVFEMVEKGLLTDDQFKAFTFGHAVKLHAGMNPDFFKGTAIEDAVEAELTARQPTPA